MPGLADWQRQASLGGKAQSQPRDAAGAGPGLGRGLAIDAPQRRQRPTLPTLLMLVQCH